MDDSEYRWWLRAVEELRDILMDVAQNSPFRYKDYGDIRLRLLKDKETAPLVPQFIKSGRSHDELKAHLSGIAAGDGSYAVRRRYVAEQLAPLLDYIEAKIIGSDAAPHQEGVADSLSSLDSAEVTELWAKAIQRCESDPEGAITAARSLIESTCKHILDVSWVSYEDSDDAPTLYKKVSKELNLAPDQHAEAMFKRTLSGAVNVVNGLSGIANQYGDRHGGGVGRGKASPRHARLVVNAAGTITAFLVDTWVERKK